MAVAHLILSPAQQVIPILHAVLVDRGKPVTRKLVPRYSPVAEARSLAEIPHRNRELSARREKLAGSLEQSEAPVAAREVMQQTEDDDEIEALAVQSRETVGREIEADDARFGADLARRVPSFAEKWGARVDTDVGQRPQAGVGCGAHPSAVAAAQVEDPQAPAREGR